jgi:hypothetical protein
MEKTYTYTARSAVDSAKTVTFTLHDHSMSVELGVPLEQIERALKSVADDSTDEQERDLQTWLRPVALALLQQGMRPFHVGDVEAELEGEGLRVTAWGRPGGLRLAPFVVAMERVDNTDAAQAFVDELGKRQGSITEPALLPGPLDYWAGWFLAGVSVALLAVRWLWKRRNAQA